VDIGDGPTHVLAAEHRTGAEDRIPFGRVQFENDHDWVGDRRVAVRPAGGDWAIRDVQYEGDDRFAPGPYEAVLVGKDGASAVVPFEVAAGEDRRVSFGALQPGDGRVTVRVRGLDGPTRMFIDVIGLVVRSQDLRGDDTIELSGLPRIPGAVCSVTVGEARDFPVSIPGALEIKLGPPRDLALRVLTPDGAPASGVMTVLAAAPTSALRTDGSGCVRHANVLPGGVTVILEHERLGRMERLVHFDAASPDELELRFPRLE
jgi:hypothetical protein